MEEAAAKMMVEKNAWLCLQPFLETDKSPFPEGSTNWLKQQQMRKGTDAAYLLAKKYKIKTAFGSDVLFDADKAVHRSLGITKLTRWYNAFEILNMVTAVNGELVSLSGPRNPYPHKLGIIEEGAYADLLLVNGNPLQNIRLIEDPDRNFVMIMKNGVIYKNKIAQ